MKLEETGITVLLTTPRGVVRIEVDQTKVLVFDPENAAKGRQLHPLRNLLYRKFEDIITTLDNLTRGA